MQLFTGSNISLFESNKAKFLTLERRKVEPEYSNITLSYIFLNHIAVERSLNVSKS
jgi:hypothetical protein